MAKLHCPKGPALNSSGLYIHVAGLVMTPSTGVPDQVTAVPEVRCLPLQPGDEFLLLACDGIWDVLSNQEVRAAVPPPPAAGGGFINHCLSVALLSHQTKISQQTPVSARRVSCNAALVQGECCCRRVTKGVSGSSRVAKVLLRGRAQAVDFVRKRLARRMSPRAICEALCDHCLASDTQVGC